MYDDLPAKLPEDPKIQIIDGRCLRMMGQAVAVVWPTRQRITVGYIDGVSVSGTWYEVSGDPYIDFVALREIEGETCIDEDSPVSGGLPPSYALMVARELEAAVAYIQALPPRVV